MRAGIPIYGLLFFGICFGLGYPSLNRFDPRTAAGCTSSNAYIPEVTGEPSDNLFQYRVLVPWLAKPIYRIAQGRMHSWSPVAFSFLVSNSLFTSIGALLLLRLGKRCALPFSSAFSGTLLYLLNFTIPNRQLGCSVVESGEACCMLALFCLLLERKYVLLPVLGLVGALAKESFVPMAAMATAGWAAIEFKNNRWKLNQTLWASAMIFVGLGTVVLLVRKVTGSLLWPWQFAADLRAAGGVSLFRGLLGTVANHYFWYVFVWLLPLGAVGLKYMPKNWLFASLGGAAAALAMGAWNNAADNTVPSIFNAIGPLLSLSAAHYLVSAKGAWSVPQVPLDEPE